jgi:hypothetical protein
MPQHPLHLAGFLRKKPERLQGFRVSVRGVGPGEHKIRWYDDAGGDRICQCRPGVHHRHCHRKRHWVVPHVRVVGNDHRHVDATREPGLMILCEGADAAAGGQQDDGKQEMTPSTPTGTPRLWLILFHGHPFQVFTDYNTIQIQRLRHIARLARLTKSLDFHRGFSFDWE